MQLIVIHLAKINISLKYRESIAAAKFIHEVHVARAESRTSVINFPEGSGKARCIIRVMQNAHTPYLQLSPIHARMIISVPP